MPTFPIQETISIAPTLHVDAFADGDVLFTDMQLANVSKDTGKGLALMTVALSDLAKQNAAFDLLFFSAEPASGTYTVNGAFTLHDTDALLFVGHVRILASDYADAAASSVATIRNINLQMTPSGRDLYVIGVSRGIPDYVAATDMKITFEFLQD